MHGTVTGNRSCGDVMLSVWHELLRGIVIKKYSCDVFFTAGSGVYRESDYLCRRKKAVDGRARSGPLSLKKNVCARKQGTGSRARPCSLSFKKIACAWKQAMDSRHYT